MNLSVFQKLSISVGILLCFFQFVSAQNDNYNNPRIERPFGTQASLQYYDEDQVFFVIKADYMVTHYLDLEASAGTYCYSIGPKIILNRKESQSRFAPFVGLQFSKYNTDNQLNIPVGLSFIGKRGIYLTAGITEFLYRSEEWDAFMLDFSFGWRF